jgi:CHAT domain-containing protein
MKDSLSAADFQPSILRSMRLGVLSACSTGRGQKDGLLDTQNLVHSFLAGGVPSVVASRWSVDSESTARLMNAFYEGLHKQKTISEALHSARVEILHAQPHPFYWAAFNLSGRGE